MALLPNTILGSLQTFDRATRRLDPWEDMALRPGAIQPFDPGRGYCTNGTAVGVQLMQDQANRAMRDHMMDMIRTTISPQVVTSFSEAYAAPVSQNKTLLLL